MKKESDTLSTLALANDDPLKIFSNWYDKVQKSGLKEPNAVCLATATKCGAPSSRMVLLKDFNEEGFVIYTNLNSRKGKNIKENPQASLCFHWSEFNRQVIIEGAVAKVSDEEADAYFISRPFKSKVGAWASKQSEVMKSRKDFLADIAKYSAKWALGDVARPTYWSGLRIIPDYFEFCDDNDPDAPKCLVFKNIEDKWYSGVIPLE